MKGFLLRKVKAIRYETYRPSAEAMPINSLTIECRDGKVLRIPNGGWTPNNPALCVMAFLGVRPSTLDEAVGKWIPVKVLDNDDYVVPDPVVNVGQVALKRRAWFEPEGEGEDDSAVEVEMVDSGGGGSDPVA